MANDSHQIGFLVGEILEVTARKYPEKIALISREEQLTFKTVNEHASCLTGHLRTEGVKPGDRVDVIATIDLGGGRENKVTKTILQDTLVLSVGRHVTNNLARIVEADAANGRERIKNLSEDTSFSSLTVEVNPAQAQQIALLIAAGDNSLTLALRNNDDSELTVLPATTFGDVLGADAARIPRAPAGGRR